MPELVQKSEIVERAQSNYKRDMEHWGPIYDKALEDLEFLSDDEFAQWDPKDYAARVAAGKPAITVDQLSQFCHQVINDARMNTPSINIIPADGDSTSENAELIKGLIRNIEYVSGADDAYDVAINYSVKSSIGFIRVDHDYVDDDTDDMWLPDKFAVQVSAFEPDDVVVYSDIVDMVDATGELTTPVTAVLGDQPAMSRLLARGSFLALNSATVRASAVARIDETMRLCDLQLWLGVARHGRFRYVPHEVGVVRLHGTSMSRTETLIGDRLRLLANHARGPQERAWARVRGRALMKAALVADRRPPLATFIEYGQGCRDPIVLPFVAAAAIPGGRRLARAIR